MFWYLMDVLALKKLGLARPLRFVFLVVFLLCLIVGVIYAAVVLRAVSERSRTPHVDAYSTH